MAVRLFTLLLAKVITTSSGFFLAGELTSMLVTVGVVRSVLLLLHSLVFWFGFVCFESHIKPKLYFIRLGSVLDFVV